MSPADLSDLSSTNNNQALSLPKLRSDGSNWATYSERILNYLTSKGYRRHVQGTARKPETLTQRDGGFFRANATAPLSDVELENHEDAVDAPVARNFVNNVSAMPIEPVCIIPITFLQ